MVNYKMLTRGDEDYLEAVYLLTRRGKVTRVRDLAKFLNVKMPSVVAALRTLKRKGLVQQERYSYVVLTTAGERVARAVYHRHQAVYRFLREVLGLDERTAQLDACRIEHDITPQTLKRLQKFVDKFEFRRW